MEPLRVAVIGAGRHARGHFEMIANEPRVQLECIAELDTSRLHESAAKHKPKAVYTDYRKMFDERRIDIVYVITMTGHLTPIVIESLQRGINISVEKSPGLTPEDTQQMADAEKKSTARAMVSFNRRYFPEILAVRKMVRDRGGAVHVSATYNKTLQPTYLAAQARGIVPDAIVGDAIHHVDLIRWLAGSSHETGAKPIEVYSEVTSGSRSGSYRRSAVVRFDTGVMGTLMSHYGVGFRIQRAEIHAEDFSAYLDMTSGRNIEMYEAGRDADGSVVGTEIKDPIDLDTVGGANFNETTHFVDCILNDAIPWSNLDDAVITMRLCEAIRTGHKGTLE